jgi:hypothetical protein
MTTAITTQTPGQIAEQVAIIGDLSKLSAEQRMSYYGEVCRSMGLNPLTRPFQYITLNGRLTLYATRDCTDQLRKMHKVSMSITGRERIDDVYVVTARATTPDGRTDESTGVVPIGNLKGDNLANALMKAETKAKRRVTMSICGLGWMDETETETVRDAAPARVDPSTGEILDGPTAPAHKAPANDGERQGLINAVIALGTEITAAELWVSEAEKPKMGELRRMSLEDLRSLAEQYQARLDSAVPQAA